MDLANALYVSLGTLTGATAVIVSTLAALRVEEIDGRKVYESNGNLQPHFVGLDDALKRKLATEGDGRVIYSLANVLRLRRPVVIMDEAHNARTPLSFETLTRFHPSCVIEFTATPELNHNPAMQVYASNVLHHVSARELKEAEMIKLPIKLRTRPDWKIVLAIAMRTITERIKRSCSAKKRRRSKWPPRIVSRSMKTDTRRAANTREATSSSGTTSRTSAR
jgi:type III restriction enzyme